MSGPGPGGRPPQQQHTPLVFGEGYVASKANKPPRLSSSRRLRPAAAARPQLLAAAAAAGRRPSAATAAACGGPAASATIRALTHPRFPTVRPPDRPTRPQPTERAPPFARARARG